MAWTDNYRVIDEPYDNTEDLQPFYDALRERIQAAGQAAATAGPPLATPNATFGSQWREEDEIPTKIPLEMRWNGGSVDPMSNPPEFAAEPLVSGRLPSDYDYRGLHNLMRAQYIRSPQEPEPSWWSATPDNADKLPMGLSTSAYNLRRNLADFLKPFYGGATPKPAGKWATAAPTQPAKPTTPMPQSPGMWDNYDEAFTAAMHSGDQKAIQKYIDSAGIGW
jgi:hypothetical protein